MIFRAALVALAFAGIAFSPAEASEDCSYAHSIPGDENNCYQSLGAAASAAKNLMGPIGEHMQQAEKEQTVMGAKYVFRAPDVDPEQQLAGFDANGPFGQACGDESDCTSLIEAIGEIRNQIKNYADSLDYCLGEEQQRTIAVEPVLFSRGGEHGLHGDTYSYLSHSANTWYSIDLGRLSNDSSCDTRNVPSRGGYVEHLTYYYCPEGYMGEVRDDRLSGYCHSPATFTVTANFSPQSCGGDSGNSDGKSCKESHEGNPINIFNGNKFETEQDYSAGGLNLVRHYHSAQVFDSGTMGAGWSFNYHQRLIFNKEGDNRSGVRAHVNEIGYLQAANGYKTNTHRLFGVEGVTLAFDEANDEWILHNGQERKIFGPDGQMIRIENGGRKISLEYNNEGNLQRVSNAFGRALEFVYADGRLEEVILPDGLSVDYVYSGNKLTEAVYPDGSSRQYHYEDKNSDTLLTGVSDEKGIRYSTFEYDEFGFAVSSVNAGNVNPVTVSRDSGAVEVTRPGRGTATVSFETHWGLRHLTAVESDSGAAIGFSARTRTVNTYGYDTGFVDLEGRETQLTLDSYGHETARTVAVGTPDEKIITRNVDPLTGVLHSVNEPGRSTSYSYDEHGNRVGMTVMDTVSGISRRTTWQYDELGQVVSVDGPRVDASDVTTYTYDTQGNMASVTNALGQTTLFTDYDSHGNPLRVVDANGVVTTMRYDARQRLVSRTVADGSSFAATTEFFYDAAGQLVETVMPNGAFVRYEYDAAHRLVAIEDSLGNRMDYTLDDLGNRLSETVSGPMQGVTRETFKEYDSLGRLVAQIGGEGQRTTFETDLEGKRTAVTDPAFNRTEMHYDALNRLFETVDALGGVTRYDYDPRDNLAEVADPRGVTTNYTYNGFGELLETRSPDAGTATYAYDAAGNRISQTDARGVTTYFEYDALNRLTFIDYPGDDKDITYTYDAGSYGKGRLTSITDESGTTAYEYNPRGELVSKQTVVQGQALDIGYEYDAAGNVTAMAYPDGQRVTYERDALGRVGGISVTGNDGVVQDIVSNVAYQPFGPVNGLVYGNGLAESRSFDNDGRITAITVPGILERSYSWDSTNNITGITNHLDSAKSQGFDYDALYRLTWANGSYGDITYDYDAVGNRLRKDENGTVTRYGYAVESNRLVSVENANGFTGYQYDAAGNTLSDGAAEYSYDVRNRFTTASPAGDASSFTYVHNALGQRVVKPRFQTALPGDASGDGVIDQNDLLSLHDMIKGRIPTSAAADCNQDGNVDNKDVSCIANQLGGTKNNGQKTGQGNGKKSDSSSDRAVSTYAASVTGDVGDIVGHTLFAYDEAGHLIGEYDELGNPLRQYVWLNDRPVAMLANGQVYYIHADHLNTPQIVTDANQAVVWQGSYSPFGDVAAEVSSVEMNLRFPGQYYDAETELNYNYFRTYNPATGRYTQSDPIGLRGGLNPFGYSEQDPLGNYDEFGLFIASVHMLITTEALMNSKSCGPEWQSTVMRSVIWADFLEGSQQVENSHWHAMRQPDESPSDASKKSFDFVREQMKTCSPVGLGRALHVVQDSSSPSHRGYQEYNGSVGAGHITGDINQTDQVMNEAIIRSQHLIEQFLASCPCDCKVSK